MRLRRDLAVDPQLVIYEFDVKASEHADKIARLVLGVLHIRSNQKNSNAVVTKQAVTRLALQELEERAKRGALQPAVCILTGDTNLLSTDCDLIVQPEHGDRDVHKDWHTVTSSSGLSGDVAFIKGARSKQFEIAVGKNYADPGIREDNHDFFGFILYMPLVQVTSPSEAPQPTAQETSELAQPTACRGGVAQPAEHSASTPGSLSEGPSSSADGTEFTVIEETAGASTEEWVRED